MDPEDLEDDLHEGEIDEGQEGEDNEAEGGQGSDAPGQDEVQADGEEGAEEVAEQPQRRVSRAEGRIQKLANEAREANERAARVERELNEIRAERSRREAEQQQKEPSPEEMALWSTDQIVDYKLNKALGKFNQTTQQLAFQQQETSDKQAFQLLQQTDPRAKKYAGEVETRLADLRKQGQNVSREALLKFIIGEKVLTNGSKALKTQRDAGQQRIQRQRGAGSAPRSDTQGGRSPASEAEKRRQRLENVTF